MNKGYEILEYNNDGIQKLKRLSDDTIFEIGSQTGDGIIEEFIKTPSDIYVIFVEDYMSYPLSEQYIIIDKTNQQ